MEALLGKLAELQISLQARGADLDIFDPGNNLDDALLSAIRENKTALLTFLENASGLEASDIIPPAPDKPYFPLTNAQNRLYFLHEFDKTSVAYNMPLALRLRGTIYQAKLEQTLYRLAERHATLRTSFELINDQSVQKISTDVKFDVTYLQAKEEELHMIYRQFIRPFDLRQAPLLRIGLARISEEDHLLILDMHHIIADGISAHVLIQDFAALYNNETLPSLKLQFKDFAAWQQSPQRQVAMAGQREFWLRSFQDGVAPLDLPADHSRPSVMSYAGNSFRFTVDEDITRRLYALSSREGVTPFMMLLSVYAVLLTKLADKDDIVIGSLAAGRPHADLQQVTGMFVNTLPIRLYAGKELTFASFLSEVKKRVLACIDNQDYQIESLLEELQIQRDASRNPLFDVLFDFINYDVPVFKISGLDIQPFTSNRTVAKFDLTLSVAPEDNQLSFILEYATSLFSESTISRFAAYFRKIITSVINDPAITIAAIDMLPEDEKATLLFQFNNTQYTYPGPGTVTALFEKQAARTPDKVAVVFEEVVLTYRQLDEQANNIAAHLRNRYRIGPGGVVGIMATRSALMLAGMIGIMKSGAAYLPLDPGYPEERLSYILSDSKASLVLVSRETEKKLAAGGNSICLEEIPQEPGSPVTGALSGADLCYVIYTSGSTGNPKGVMIPHGNLVNFFHGLGQRLPVNEKDCMLAITSTSFDISALELLWTLCRGIEVIIHPSDVPLTSLDRYVVTENDSMDFSLLFFSSYSNKDREKYNLLLDCARYADRSGFQAVWTPERHFHEFGGLYPNPSVTSAALAMVTNRIGLRCGSVVSPLHDPLRIAEEWSVVDNLSKGRVAISFASGWNPNDFVVNKANYQDRQRVMYEQIETVRQLWQDNAIKRINGLGKEVSLRIFPAPVQPELPVWITSGGSEDTFISAGAAGANLLTHLLGQDLEELSRKIKLYRDARKQNGHQGAGKVAVMLHTFVGETIEDVERVVEEPFIEYLKSAIGVSKILSEESGIHEETIPEEKKKMILKNAFYRYYKTSSLIGTMSTCSEMVLKLKTIGIDEIACLVDFGVAQSEIMKGLENLNKLRLLFARQRQSNHSPVTILQSTPSFMRLALDAGGSNQLLRSLRLLLLGGEAIPLFLVKELTKEYTARIYNMYGPTETTVWSCIQELHGSDERIRVGKPIANTQIYILNGELQMVPMGVAGNLYIGGKGLAAGYWNRPDLTRERFIENPHLPGSLIYKTGDIARWRADGTIELLGREDFQMKIRGYRVEPGEIETQLSSFDGIRESVVMVTDQENAGSLVAYYVAEAPLDASELRRHLSQKLPDYMIPSFFVYLDKMPLTPNGKINRRMLPVPGLKADKDHEPPCNEVEAALVAIWSDVLKTSQEKISVTADFFRLGGHSLGAMILVKRIEKKFGRNVPLRMFYNISTIREIAAYINAITVQDTVPHREEEEEFTF